MNIKFRKYFFLFMFFIILFTISYAGIYYRKGDKSPALYNAFESSGAKFVNSEVYVWCRVVDNYKNSKQLVAVADQLVVDIGMVENDRLSRNTINNDFINKTEIKGCTADGKTVCINAQLSKSDENEGFISVSVTDELSQLEVSDTANLLRNKFISFGMKPKVNTCIIGCFDGKLDYEEMNRISRLILNDAKAKKVNGMAEKNLISVSAYSPLIDDNISVEGRMVNMNLALRYNAYEDKTYIWLATPVITIEY